MSAPKQTLGDQSSFLTHNASSSSPIGKTRSQGFVLPQVAKPDVLDFSFRGLKSLQALITEIPRASKTLERPTFEDAASVASFASISADGSSGPSSPHGSAAASQNNAVAKAATKKKGRAGAEEEEAPPPLYSCAILKLANNEISSLSSLPSVLNTIIVDPLAITWLDLSFNQLTTLDDELFGLSNLSVLYLHGNQLSELKDCVKVGRLRQIKNLTLHGNPVEDKYKNWKFHILCHCPWIKNIDFTAVTPRDLETAQTYKDLYLSAPRSPKRSEM